MDSAAEAPAVREGVSSALGKLGKIQDARQRLKRYVRMLLCKLAW